jgi:hypothetical protein
MNEYLAKIFIHLLLTPLSSAKEEEDESDDGLSDVPDNLTVYTPSEFR